MNVAFLIYKRPDLAQQVFREIEKVRPKRLFVVADGPKPGEESLCRETREVIEAVSWPCEVLRNLADRNLGCRDRVSSGLSWVFGQVDHAIVLEEDCLPDASFFSFCDELLDRYRDDNRIGHINGTSVSPETIEPGDSYYFSRYCSIWGWATWRRAWKEYDRNLSAWPDIRAKQGHYKMFPMESVARSFESRWDLAYSGKLDTWDTQWTFSLLRHGLLSITPAVNLVTNLGFREDGTHLTDSVHRVAGLKTSKVDFPLRHPGDIAPNIEADRRCVKLFYERPRFSWPDIADAIRNKHMYGIHLRRIPVLGRIWAALRGGRKMSGGNT